MNKLSPILLILSFCCSVTHSLQSASVAAVAPVQSDKKTKKNKTAKIIVRVNKDVITNCDVRDRCRLIAFLSNKPGDKKFIESIRQQVLERMIDETIREQMATKFKINISEKDLSGEIEDYAKQLGYTVEEFRKFLTEKHILVSLEKLIKSNILYQILIASGVSKDKVTIPESHIDTYMSKMAEQNSKMQYDVYEIVLYPTKTESAESIAGRTYNELCNLVKKIKPVVAFEFFTQQFSQGPSAANGGSLGWLSEDKMSKAMKSVVPGLEIFSFSKPVKINDNEYRIFFLNDIKKPGFLPQSDTNISFAIVHIPYNQNSTADEQMLINNQIDVLSKATSKQDMEKKAEEFNLKFEIITLKLSKAPEQIANGALNVCLPPIMTAEDQISIIKPLAKTLDKYKVNSDREMIKKELEHGIRLVEANKILNIQKRSALIEHE